MKLTVISYSLTGNNDALAESIAKELAVEHIRITEPKPRSTGTTILDQIFSRIPSVKPMPETIEKYDLILFLGPIWMGQIATPLRAYLKYLQANPCRYAFISISGGADGPNTKLADELTKRTGIEPIALIDMHIADLLPPNPKPTRKDTSAYHLTDRDVRDLTSKIVKRLKKAMAKF